MSQYDVFVYTMNQGGTRGRWSRYRFPFLIEYFAHLEDDMYVLHGNRIVRVVENYLYDDGVPFESVIQWPWVDFKMPGRTKMLAGFDVVGEGSCMVQMGYDQGDVQAYTPAFDVPGDTYTGMIVPLPVSAPTFSLKLIYESSSNWEWAAGTLYMADHGLAK